MEEGGNSADDARLTAYLSASPATRRLPRWLARRNLADRPWGEVEKSEARRQFLDELVAFVPSAKPFPKLRADLAELIATLVRDSEWKRSDAPYLVNVANTLLAADQPSQSANVRQKVEKQELPVWVKRLWTLAPAHAVVWILLLGIYPQSRTVQALFFSNSRIRKVMAAGYVDVALRVFPWARQRLFRPFRESLVPRAETDVFDQSAYFNHSQVVSTHAGRQRLNAAGEIFSPLRGQHVIEAASGLGKTTLLRFLATKQQKPLVFLRATDCPDGPLEGDSGSFTGQGTRGTLPGGSDACRRSRCIHRWIK